MTIREHSPPSPSPAADAEDPIIATGSSIDQVSTPTLPPVMTDGPADDRTSPPVIEIIDDDENVFPTSVPRSLSAEEYFESFPFSTEHRTSLQTLHVITEHIHKSEVGLRLDWFFTIADTDQVRVSLPIFSHCLPGGSEDFLMTPQKTYRAST